MHRRTFLMGLPFALSACAGERVWAPDDVVSRAFTPGSDIKSLTLYTMKNTGSDNGAHSALMIDASQRVMFDPAGTWKQNYMPERNDVLFGVTPRMEQFYVSVHARVTYYVVGHRITVAPEIAEQALQKALVAGPVAPANCTRYTARLLRSLPGFESLPQTWFPNALSDAFGQLPGVTTREYRETDSDDKNRAQAVVPTAGQ
ncbi:hypothetical protein [Yoonia sp. 2307UL14-13]|uniref:hypothetical protein n=1 Tax=Yoonia sp. 2307UL14-13 TaxID=3126506 RepID=UPI0030A4130C